MTVDALDARITAIREEEQRLLFTTFTHDDAWQLGLLAVELAQNRGLAVAVDVRRGDQQMFHSALAGSTADNDGWILRKVATVRRFSRSSLLVRLEHEQSDKVFELQPGNDPRTHAASGGAFPIAGHGMGVIGVLTISGLPDWEDHALVVEVIDGFLQGQRARNN